MGVESSESIAFGTEGVKRRANIQQKIGEHLSFDGDEGKRRRGKAIYSRRATWFYSSTGRVGCLQIRGKA